MPPIALYLFYYLGRYAARAPIAEAARQMIVNSSFHDVLCLIDDCSQALFHSTAAVLRLGGLFFGSNPSIEMKPHSEIIPATVILGCHLWELFSSKSGDDQGRLMTGSGDQRQVETTSGH